MKLLPSLGLALLATACGLHFPAMMTPHDRYDAMCNSWVNSTINELVVAWGEATKVNILTDGTQMYEWDNVEGTNLPPERIAHFSRAQERGAAWCSTRFVVDRRSIITSFAWNGGNYNDNVNFRLGCATDYQPPQPAPATTAAR